jgi:hypothetical protein
MACHTITQTATDFLWSLKDHAFPPKVPGLMMQDVEMRNLRTMMQTTRQAQIPSEKTKPNPKVKPTPRP